MEINFRLLSDIYPKERKPKKINPKSIFKNLKPNDKGKKPLFVKMKENDKEIANQMGKRKAELNKIRTRRRR